MKRSREARLDAHLQGVLSQIAAIKGRTPTPDALRNIQQSAMDARDVLLKPDAEEQRFWAAIIVFSQSAEVYVRKVFGREIEKVRIVDDEGYHWSAGQILRLAPAMMLRAA